MVGFVTGLGWLLFEGAVRSMVFVVLDVVDDEPLKLLGVPDDGAIQEFSPDRAEPALGVIRR